MDFHCCVTICAADNLVKDCVVEKKGEVLRWCSNIGKGKVCMGIRTRRLWSFPIDWIAEIQFWDIHILERWYVAISSWSHF